MGQLISLQGIPRWPGLNHFKSLSSTGEFADGTKFEDLSKVHTLRHCLAAQIDPCNDLQVLIFATIRVLSRARSPGGFLLLRLLRSYLELDMHASLTVHTDRTISSGKEELLLFNAVLQVVSTIFQ